MRVRSPEIGRLIEILAATQVGYRPTAPDTIAIDGATPEWLGPVLAQNQIVVYELVHERGSLEDVFLHLTQGFATTLPGAPGGAEAGPGTSHVGPTPMPGGVS